MLVMYCTLIVQRTVLCSACKVDGTKLLLKQALCCLTVLDFEQEGKGRRQVQSRWPEGVRTVCLSVRAEGEETEHLVSCPCLGKFGDSGQFVKVGKGVMIKANGSTYKLRDVRLPGEMYVKC